MTSFLNGQKCRSLHIKVQLDSSRLFSSACCVNVDGFKSPNPNPSNTIHQSPRVAWIRSGIPQREARKGSLQFRYFKPSKGQPVQNEQLSLGASRARTDCTQPASVAAIIMGIPAKARVAWTHFPNTKWRVHVTFIYLNTHLCFMPSKYFDSSSLCVGIPEGQC